MKNKIGKCIFTSIAAAAFAASVSFGATVVGFTFISPAGEWRGKELAKDEDVAAFAKTVANAREVARVQARVSALGCFEFYVNGKLVSVSENGMRCDFLRPGATDREKRRHYVSYDITKMWKRGAREKNTLSAFVARSWFSDLIGSRTDVKPAFGANVRVEYSDGGVETIKTDASWTASFGTPFARAGIYWGRYTTGAFPPMRRNAPAIRRQRRIWRSRGVSRRWRVPACRSGGISPCIPSRHTFTLLRPVRRMANTGASRWTADGTAKGR